MSVAYLFFGVATLLQSGNASVDTAPAADIAGQITREQAEARLSNCGVRRFETSAEGLMDGKIRRTSIRLCAADSESNEEWLGKLEKSAAQVEAQASLPSSVKLKLLTDLNAEIAKLKGSGQPAAPVVAESFTLTPRSPISRPIGNSDPLPKGLPPLPTRPLAPPATATTQAATSVATAAPAVPPLQISALCLPPGGRGAGVPCESLTRETLMAFRADTDIKGTIAVRFRQSGSEREGEVLLTRTGLRRGQSVRVRVPAAVCGGVVRAEFDVQLLRFGVAAGQLGPFRTRC